MATMETATISIHEMRVFLSLKDGRWRTSGEIAKSAKVADRTARKHCLKLVQLGILDQAAVFPGNRYRLSPNAATNNAAYHRRLHDAIGVFEG